MDREQIIQWAREAGWSGIYTQWAEPTGKPDWSPVKESLTIPVTMEQIEAFAKLVADAEAKRIYDEGMVTIGHMREQVAKEREVCAKMVDAANPFGRIAETADAIRARGQ